MIGSDGQNEIFLSIIIPVWNREREILSSVRSVARQIKDRAAEIILVDDGSTDGTPHSVCLLSAECNKVRTVRLKSNVGAAAARNAGLERACGRYVWFVDSDDFVPDGSVDRIWSELVNSMPDVLRFDKINGAAWEDVKRSLVEEPCQPVSLDLECKAEDLLFCLSNGSVWSAVFSQGAIGAVRFDENFTYGEDAPFTWAVVLRSRCGKYLPMPMYVYNQTACSMTSAKSPLRFNCYMRQVDEFIRLIERSDLCNQIKRKLVSECVWRVYSHAFGCYRPSEIDNDMWEVWRDVYRRVLTGNRRRTKVQRFLSWVSLGIQTRYIAYLVFRFLLQYRRRHRR